METAAELLRVRYYTEWKRSGLEGWKEIRSKLSVLDDIRSELRKLMAGEIDNG